MADLITLRDLSVWVRDEIDPSDAFAKKTISAASLIVAETAGHPEWTLATVPPRAALIVGQLAKRSYLNPDAVVRSNVGPLGESTVEDYARTLELTPAERAELLALRPGGNPDAGGSLFRMNLGAAPEPVVGDTRLLFDSAGSPILYHEPGDVGEPIA